MSEADQIRRTIEGLGVAVAEGFSKPLGQYLAEVNAPKPSLDEFLNGPAPEGGSDA